MTKVRKYSPETRERAVRLVFEQEGGHASQWAAMVSIAGKIGCTPETLRSWVRRAERDSGKRPGLSTDERALLQPLPARPYHSLVVDTTPRPAPKSPAPPLPTVMVERRPLSEYAELVGGAR